VAPEAPRCWEVQVAQEVREGRVEQAAQEARVAQEARLQAVVGDRCGPMR